MFKYILSTAALLILTSCSSASYSNDWDQECISQHKTPSGLEYKVLRKGSGPKPTAVSRVTVHYHGTLENGKVFDSSYRRGEYASFPLNRVIKGWTEGLQKMSPGAVYLFKIPPQLAYGSAGAGNTIPPNSTLFFKIELIRFK